MRTMSKGPDRVGGSPELLREQCAVNGGEQEKQKECAGELAAEECYERECRGEDQDNGPEAEEVGGAVVGVGLEEEQE